SALLLIAFAYGAAAFDGPIGTGIITGLKIVAVAIVAQAVWGMGRNLCPDKERATIALVAVLIVIGVAGAFGQVAAIVVGALSGLIVCRAEAGIVSGHVTFPVSRGVGLASFALFAVLLIGL